MTRTWCGVWRRAWWSVRRRRTTRGAGTWSRRSPAAETARAEGLALAAGAVPYACNDWGLQRMHFEPDREYGPCVDYDDGYGVRYEVCAQSPFVQARGEPGG